MPKTISIFVSARVLLKLGIQSKEEKAGPTTVPNWCGADGGSGLVGAAAAAVGMGIESAPGPGVLRIELPELKPEAKELVASTLALSDKDDSSAKRTSCVILHLALGNRYSQICSAFVHQYFLVHLSISSKAKASSSMMALKSSLLD